MGAEAVWNGRVIARSDDTIVIEGNHYFPVDSVDPAFLVPSETTSRCPWKGTAKYLTLVVDGRENRDAAWYYPAPKAAASTIAGRVAFWRGVTVNELADTGGVGAMSSPGSAPRRRWWQRRAGGDPVGAALGDPAPIVEIDDRNFLAATAGRVMIVDFWAAWCGPCRSFHPHFERLARTHASDTLGFGRCDVERSRRTAAMLALQSIPTLIAFDAAGDEVERIVGVPAADQLAALLARAQGAAG
ncbi:MAG: DUF427 domain-containing protein [Acidimicrobiia bacterium]